MTICPHCRAHGVYVDDGRRVCLFCAHEISSPEPGTLEKLLSNMTPDKVLDGVEIGPRVAPDLSAIKARVIAAVRAEAIL